MFRPGVLLVLGIVLAGGLTAAWRDTQDVIDTQNTDTLLRGQYQAYAGFYEAGGVLVRTSVGIADFIQLGATEDLERLIGFEGVIPSIPMVSLKVRILKYNPGWSLGYDQFYVGNFGVDRAADTGGPRYPVSGFYTCVALPLFFSDQEKRLIFGLRMPMLPRVLPQDTSPYIALLFPINEAFELHAEMSNLFFSGDRLNQVIWGLGARLSIGTALSIELNLKYSAWQGAVDRILSLDYTGSFLTP